MPKYPEIDAGEILVHLCGGMRECSGRKYDNRWEDSARRRKACSKALDITRPPARWLVRTSCDESAFYQSVLLLSVEKGAAIRKRSQRPRTKYPETRS